MLLKKLEEDEVERKKREQLIKEKEKEFVGSLGVTYIN